MFRYVALIFNPENREAAHTVRCFRRRILDLSKDLSVAFRAQRLVLLAGGTGAGATHLLSEEMGAVVGTLFDRNSSERNIEPPAFNLHRSGEIVKSRGAILLQHYWGSYVAFIRDPVDDRIHVLRAPCSRLPCLWTCCSGVRIFFSRTEDWIHLSPHRSIDWNYVSQHLLYRGLYDLSGHSTGIEGISRLHGGECASVGHSTMRIRQLWSPLHAARAPAIEDPEVAADILKRVLLRTVSALASPHRRVSLFLSGGLDSSIVLSCLARMPDPPHIVCINYYGAYSEGDERRLARLAAGHFGIRLLEHYRDHAGTDMRELLNAERTALPLLYTSQLLNGPLEAEIANRHATTATFTGFLGDAIFFRSAHIYAPLDYVWMRGPGWKLPTIALETARQEGRLLWKVILESILWRYRQPSPPHLPSAEERLLASGLLKECSADDLSPVQGRLPPGKQSHLFGTSLSHCYHDPFNLPGRPEVIPALMSQPVLETVLRIPSFVLAEGGRDRALVRRAFTEVLPSVIINRRTKGSGSLQSRRLLEANRIFIRELLLDGILSRETLVNRPKLERCLGSSDGLATGIAADLPVLYSTEAWLRSWLRPEIAAAKERESLSLS